MGFFSKILGSGKEYPPLESGHPATERMRQAQASLDQLATEIPDPLEVVPAEKGIYVFAGKPPTKFGMFWIQGNEIHNFKTLSKAKGLSSLDLRPIVEQLRDVYKKHQEEERFSYGAAGRSIIVTPSQNLGAGVEKIIQQAAS
jgi:hypothetical protein